jgi:hypothetical protein
MKRRDQYAQEEYKTFDLENLEKSIEAVKKKKEKELERRRAAARVTGSAPSAASPKGSAKQDKPQDGKRNFINKIF